MANRLGMGELNTRERGVARAGNMGREPSKVFNRDKFVQLT
jgi:hypothetical protein